MLTINNKKLSCTEEQICCSDTIIKLKSDIDCEYIGSLRLQDGGVKILNFIKIGDEYKARLVIAPSDIDVLQGSKFKVVMISGSMQEDSNAIELNFNVPELKKDIKVVTSNEIEELRKKIASLESTISSLQGNRVIKSMEIANKDCIKPGMIPVAVNDKGTFIAEYPFASHVSEVNGQKPLNGVVIIDGSMIEYGSSTIEQTLDIHGEAIIGLKSLLDQVVNNQKEIRSKLDELTIKVDSHINGNII